MEEKKFRMSIATVNPQAATATGELSLRRFLELLAKQHPEQMIRVNRSVDPARFEVTAVLKHLENRGKFPLVQFERPQTLHGKPSPYPRFWNGFNSEAAPDFEASCQAILAALDC